VPDKNPGGFFNGPTSFSPVDALIIAYYALFVKQIGGAKTAQKSRLLGDSLIILS